MTTTATPATTTATEESRLNPPERPLVSIRAGGGFASVDLKSLWAYRELLYFLTWRDVKVRYKQTALGAAWAVIQPLFTVIVFSIFFGKLANLPSEGIPYPLFAFAAVLPWTFFSNTVTGSGNSLVGSANLITKVYFPRMIIPAAAVAAGLIDLMIAFGVLIVLMIYYSVGVTWRLSMVPALVVLTTLLAAAVGMWTSALNVKYRDIRHALPFAIQLTMFATPIIYPASIVPERWRWALNLNPLTGIIEGYRAAFFGRPFDWGALAISAAITFALLVYAAYHFKRMERTFADVV
ncbi:MAG: ABC transporter permease [Blastocatellia bacterium]|nr:ABC transporter permease [Blastocatellia bacterium]